MGRLRTVGSGLGALLALILMPTAIAAPAQTETQPETDDDPTYSVDLAELDAALDCDEFTHPDTEPVLLIHGTFTSGHEQFDWSYAPFLREAGHDVCIVTYPDRGLGDMQISAEYVARAVQRIHAESGQMVDMVGHSQGALMPRWAIKYWPSVRAAIDDFVLLAGPHHGTSLALDASEVTGEQPAVFFQFALGSNFTTALNDGDETPGEIDYTSIYTRLDEVVRPVDPPTATLDLATADDDPRVANIATQELCPARAVDHVTIGTTDALTMQLTLDALDHDGPTDAARAGVDEELCEVPDQYVTPDSLAALLGRIPDSVEEGVPEFHLVSEEPPLRSYADPPDATGDGDDSTEDRDGDEDDSSDQDGDVDEDSDADEDGSDLGDPDRDSASGGDGGDAPDTEEPGSSDPSTDEEPASGPSDGGSAVATDTGVRTIAVAGRAIPILAAGIAIAVALLLRLGSTRIRDGDAGPEDTTPTESTPPDGEG